MCRSNPQLTLANHLSCLTSLAPELEPSRLCSSLIRSFLIAALHRLTRVSVEPDVQSRSHLVTGVVSG